MPHNSAALSEPYPGPRPFDKRERAIFFGRDEETADLRDLCMSYQVVVLYSQSGAGKSSLVRAGLRPKLIEQRVNILPVARVSGAADVQAVEAHGNFFMRNALITLFGADAEPGKSLAENLRRHVFRGGGARPRPHAIIFDQFEELFTTNVDRWREREGFFGQIKEALKEDSELRAIFVLREERLADLDTYSDLVPTNFRIRYRLERLKEETALLAIQNPPEKFGWRIAEEDARQLVENLRQIRIRAGTIIRQAEGEYVEPVHLQVICQDIWRQRDRSSPEKLLKAPKDVGNIDRALSTYYDAAVIKAGHEGKSRESKIREWVERELITSRGTRGFVYKGEKTTEGLPNTALEILEREHIVRSEPRAGESWFELTHDRFIAPITNSNRMWRERRHRSRLPLYGLLLLFFGLGIYELTLMIWQAHKDADESKNAQQALTDFDDAERVEQQARDASRNGNALDSSEKWGDAFKAYGKAATSYRAARLPIPQDLYDHQQADLIQEDLESGQVLFKSGNTAGAIQRLNQAAAGFLKEQNATQEARAEGLLGNAWLRMGKFDEASGHYSNAANLLTKFEDSPQAFNYNLNLGIIESQKGRYDASLGIYDSISGFERNSSGIFPSRLWREIAFDEFHLGNYGDALEHLRNAKGIAAQENADQQALIPLYFAECYLDWAEQRLHQAHVRKSGQRASDPDGEIKELLEKSGGSIPEEPKRFKQDSVMTGAATVFWARVDIALGEILKSDDSQAAQDKFDSASQKLERGLEPQIPAKRNLGIAYARESEGMLAEAQRQPDAAKGEYEKAYCLYQYMKVDPQHRHFREVKDRLRALNVDLPSVDARCSTIVPDSF